MEFRRVLFRSEFLPALRAEAADIVVELLEQMQGEGVNLALGLATRAERPEAAESFAAQDRLGHDRTGRIARAEEQHVQQPIGHDQSFQSARQARSSSASW